MSFGLVMIVKDEEAVLDRCLASVRDYISHWVIYDTGSSDSTKEIIRRMLGDVPGELIDAPFVNFGHNRSLALASAQGTADWLICLDADMTIEIDPNGLVLDPEVEAYTIETGTGQLANPLPLVLRGDLAWKSVGAVHEYTMLVDGNLGIRRHMGSIRALMHGVGRSSTRKSRWYAHLLEADLKREPTNPRTVFYLAQTYKDLGERARAIKFYKRRAEMGAPAPEAFWAAYEVAGLETEWPDRVAALLTAWNMRPKRLEPLYDLVHGLNLRGQHHAAYLLSAVKIEPFDDEMFMWPLVWDWGLKFERSIACWWVGAREEFLLLSEELLANPRLPSGEREAVERNLRA